MFTQIAYKFIVVYDKFNEPVANSIKNQAGTLSINSTSWSEKDYLTNKSRLNNNNYVMFLSEDLIKKNLSNPNLQLHELIDGVKFKSEGNVVGIYVEDIDYVEFAKRLGSSQKEDWLTLVGGGLIVGGRIVGGLIAGLRYRSKQQEAKLYLLYKAVDKFHQDYLKSFVAGELNK